MENCGVVVANLKLPLCSKHYHDHHRHHQKCQKSSGAKSFMRNVAKLPAPADSQVLEGMDHFWFGHEHLLCAVVEDWMKKHGLTE
jgi:hypothetical protein